MLRNDNPYDPGVSRGTHYALIVAALIVGMLLGIAVGTRFKARQVEQLRFTRDVAGMANAANNLTMAEAGRRDEIMKLNNSLLMGHAASAYQQLPTLRRAPMPSPQIMESLARANAYAKRHNLQQLSTQIVAIHDRIAAQAQKSSGQ